MAVFDPNDVASRLGSHWLGPLFRVGAEVLLQLDSVLFVRDLEDRQELRFFAVLGFDELAGRSCELALKAKLLAIDVGGNDGLACLAQTQFLLLGRRNQLARVEFCVGAGTQRGKAEGDRCCFESGHRLSFF